MEKTSKSSKKSKKGKIKENVFKGIKRRNAKKAQTSSNGQKN